MMLSENELQSILQKNPNVRVQMQKTKSALPTEKKSTYRKYRNDPVYVYFDGYISHQKNEKNHGKVLMRFDSSREYDRFQALRILERAEHISELKRQVRIEIQPAFLYGEESIRAIYYDADFTYQEEGKRIVEDVKGFSQKTGKHIFTKDFLLKWKLLKYKYPDYEFRVY